MRTFIAVELPEALRRVVERRQHALQTALAALNAPPVFRWTPVDKVHLTLRFLGETTDAQRAEIAAALAASIVASTVASTVDVAAHWQPFTLQLGALGCFPNFRQPTVLWLGIQGDLAALQRIQTTIESIAQRIGFPAEERAYRPHLTIARSARDAIRPDLQAAGRALQTLAATPPTPGGDPAFTVSHIAHIKSDLQPAGALYSTLAEFPFSASSASSR